MSKCPASGIELPPDSPAIAAGLSRGKALAELRRLFAEQGSPSPGLDARLLAAAALRVPPAALLTHPETPLRPEEADALVRFARRRLAREPVARILGMAEFWGLPFRLSPETLVPRPDTEAVVEAALLALPERDAPLSMVDLGTGTGCILVALMTERPRAFGLGVDRSPGALATAQLNAAANGVGPRAHFAASNWADALGGPFDLIVSNPPYIRGAEIASLDTEVSRFDPPLALDGGPDGLDAYRAILSDARRLLAPAGRVVVEIGQGQAGDVAELAEARGLALVDIRRDLGGHDRALTFRIQ